MEPNADRRNNSSRNYLIAALLVLAALNVLLLYFYYVERETNRTKDASIAAKTEEIFLTKNKLDSISVQLDSRIAEIRQLGGSVDSLLRIKEQLEIDKRSLRNTNTYNQQQFETKISRYENVLTQKDRDIAQLRRENGVLTEKNTTLAQENTGLKTERQTLADSVSTYAARNRELSDKVSVAAALRAESVMVTALNTRGKESDGGSYKARRLDKIKIQFRLAPNTLTREDEKEIYLRIIDPAGATIADMATGSGEFTYNGQGMTYTAAQRLQYNSAGLPVTFVYGRGGQRFNEGRHVIELYAEGFKIGEGEFTVR